MRTLILTCNTGEGHNSSAGAIREIFELENEFCDTRESLRFTSNRFSKIVGKGHVIIYRHTPKLFNKGYEMSENNESYFAQGSFWYKLLTRGVKKLYNYVVENQIDNIICVHPFAALLVTELRRKYDIKLTTSLVATDYTCSPGTNCTKMDKYFIPHEALKDEFEKNNIMRDKLYASGIPIKQSFFGVNDKENARKLLGLPEDKKILLMCCGSMGCGHMEKIAARIREKLDEDTMVIIVCGSNKRLYNKLISEKTDNFCVVGYTKQMNEYMQACDVFLTKPGGISTTECATLRKPMLFINAVAGCELRNKQFFDRLGCAITVADNLEIPDAAIKLLSDFEKRQSLAQNMEKEFRQNAARYIYNELCENKETTL